MKKIAFTFIIICCALIGYSQTTTHSLQVKIEGISTKSGTIFATLSKDKIGFPYGENVEKKSIKLIEVDGDCIVKFDNLIEEEYAILVFQDLNGNGKLDNDGNMPTEPIGFSNLTALFGPPTFDDCKIELKASKQISINLLSF